MKTLLVIFRNIPMRHREIEKLKVELNNCLDWQNDLLHNHTPERGFNYRYPRVQFRCYDGYAALFAIDEGVPFINNLLISDYLPENFNSNYQIIKGKEELIMLDELKTYSINHFIPFDTQNFKKWTEIESLVERSAFEEQIIANHIINLCNNFGFKFPEKSLKVVLIKMNQINSQELKKSDMLCFDAVFKANINLPEYCGLGRFKSMGYGITSIISEKKIENKKIAQATHKK